MWCKVKIGLLVLIIPIILSLGGMVIRAQVFDNTSPVTNIFSCPTMDEEGNIHLDPSGSPEGTHAVLELNRNTFNISAGRPLEELNYHWSFVGTDGEGPQGKLTIRDANSPITTACFEGVPGDMFVALTVSDPDVPESIATTTVRWTVHPFTGTLPAPTITPSFTPTPLPGITSRIPGRINAEDYSLGGEGVAYHDTEPENLGKVFRINEGVDIQKQNGGGFHVAWTQIGEWIAYSVDVEETTTYQLLLRLASGSGNGRTFHLELDGIPITDVLEFPTSADWQGWVEFDGGFVTLPAGIHQLVIFFDTGRVNVDYIEFVTT